MQRNPIRRFRALLAAVAATCVTQGTIAKGDTYFIDSSQSTIQLTISVGVYDDPLDPSTFDPVLGTMVGQATALPLGNIPGGVVPLFGDGGSAQLSGALNVDIYTAGWVAFSSAGGITLLNSGLWQPNPAGDASGLPTPAQAAGYLQASLIDPDDVQVFAALSNTTFGVHTFGLLDVGPGGVFHDPFGMSTLLTNDLAGYIISPVFTGPLSYSMANPFSKYTDFNGTLLGNELIFNFSTFLDDNQEDTLGVPLIVRQAINVHIVARPVPEPGTWALAACGAVALLGVRRTSHRRLPRG